MTDSSTPFAIPIWRAWSSEPYCLFLGVFRRARRLIIFHKSINGHLSLPVGNLLQPAPRASRHSNSKSFVTLTANKDCYKNSFFVKTIKDWNSLPDGIVNITEPQQFIGIFSDSNNIFLWHESEDINKKSLNLTFQLIPILRFQVMHDYVCFIAPIVIDYCVK